MAWRSSGSTNDEMVDALKRFEVIESMDVEQAFRSVDRRFFVPQNQTSLAYSDQPLKEDNVHISAPHIYGSVLELMNLRPDTPTKVLNAGSGTGYLTCLMASILGPRSTHYCIELQEDVLQHSKESVARWKEAFPDARDIDDIHLIHGDALQITQDKGEALFGFDRIYIGASIDNEQFLRLRSLLKPGGVLVGPVEDELIQLVRFARSSDPLSDRNAKTSDFQKNVISCVRFAPMMEGRPSQAVTIPARVWQPSLHKYYPENFRQSCKALMLCANAQVMQLVQPRPTHQINVSAVLPKAIWLEILSYTHKDWFKTPQSEIELLRQQLDEERRKAQRANAARLAAEELCRTAVRERDVYRMLARRWQSRLSAESQNQSLHDDLMDDEDLMDSVVSVLRGRTRSFGNIMSSLSRRRRTLRAMESSDDDDDDDDDDNDDHYYSGIESVGEQSDSNDEDDDDDRNEDVGSDMEQSMREEEQNEISMDSDEGDRMEDVQGAMSDEEYMEQNQAASLMDTSLPAASSQSAAVSPSPFKAVSQRHQVRAVSFCDTEG